MSRKQEKYVEDVYWAAESLEGKALENDISLDPDIMVCEGNEFVYQPPIPATPHKVMYSNAQPTTRSSSAQPTVRHSQATPTIRYASQRHKKSDE